MTAQIRCCRRFEGRKHDPTTKRKELLRGNFSARSAFDRIRYMRYNGKIKTAAKTGMQWLELSLRIPVFFLIGYYPTRPIVLGTAMLPQRLSPFVPPSSCRSSASSSYGYFQFRFRCFLSDNRKQHMCSSQKNRRIGQSLLY